GLPLIGGDDVLRLPDFLFELGNRLLRLAGPARLSGHAHREPRGLDVLQGLAKLLELGAVPRNGAVTVYRHANPPDSWPNLARIGQVGPREGAGRVIEATGFARCGPAVPDSTLFLPSKRPRASLQTTNLHGDLCSARSLLSSWRQNAGLAQWSVRMSEVDFERIVDAVRK